MPELLRAFIVACTFLTRLPMPQLDNYQPEDAGRSLPMFPVVGLLIGSLLLTFAWFLNSHFDSSVLAALLLILWVLVTGALHLDGLGDSADGWLSGTSRERTLEIMKDPRSGSAAVVIIPLLLIIKFSALAAIIENQNLLTLLIAPVLARATALVLLMTTHYASENGIGEDYLAHASRSQLKISIALAALLALIVLPLATVIFGLLIIALITWSLRLLMIKRLGGVTGDTTGATIEIVEACFLIAALIY